MATTKDDVHDFFELRVGLQGAISFAAAALRFLDRHGIALGKRAVARPSNGHSPNVDAVREEVKRKYTRRATAAPGSTAEKIRRNRERSAAVLDTLDRKEPRDVPDEARLIMGALVRRGYARKKGGGYIRSAKKFVVDTRESHANGASDDEALTVSQAAKALKMSEGGVRILIKQKRLKSHSALRVQRAGTNPKPTMVVDREEIVRYAANPN